MPPDAGRWTAWRRVQERAVTLCLLLATGVVLVPVASVLYVTVRNGIAAWNWAFFTQVPAAVGASGGGVGNAIAGTALLVMLALFVAAPVGLMAGVYLSEFGREGGFPRAVRVVNDALMGVPTIVLGIFVYAAVVVPMGHFSALAGSVALALILIPTVVRVTEDMLRMVPPELRDAGLALGVPEWRVITSIVLRAAFPGILTGIALGVARIAGETAPLLFTAFGNPNWALNPLQPVSALPLQVFLDAVSPYADLQQKAWGAALLLIVIVACGNGFARAYTYGRKVG
ncbi:MAG: phosphate ABC transporter permease PstA [Firmicutes bacterium]|nr:phosphate ABC transporter permease PstA [Bacillota bacterium]